MTDGMATRRPNAVVMRASAMPADTGPRPPDPEAAMAWKEASAGPGKTNTVPPSTPCDHAEGDSVQASPTASSAAATTALGRG